MTKTRTSLFTVLLHLLPAFLFCGVFAAVGILHVSSRILVVRTGYRLSELQNEHRVLGREHDRLKLELATLKSPNRLEKVARTELGMAPPSPNAVITLVSSPRMGRTGGELTRRERPTPTTAVARASAERPVP